MGIQERKEREKEERRAKILEAATDLFITEGFEKTTIRAIATRIEYSPGTIYLYFKDKEAILSELFQITFEAFGKKLMEAEAETDPIRRIMLVGQKYIEYALAHPAHFELMFMMKHQHLMHPHELQDHEDALASSQNTNNDGYLYLKYCLERAETAGYKLRMPVEASALMAWSGVHGYACIAIRGFLGMYKGEADPAMYKWLPQVSIYSLFSNLPD